MKKRKKIVETSGSGGAGTESKQLCTKRMLFTLVIGICTYNQVRRSNAI